jgi:hypothetical protein
MPLKIQLQRELHLPAFVDGIRDLPESGRGQIISRFTKLRCVEEVDEFRPEERPDLGAVRQFAALSKHSCWA